MQEDYLRDPSLQAPHAAQYESHLPANFLSRWNPLFKTYRGSVAWFNLWTLARELSIGIVLGVVANSPVRNAGEIGAPVVPIFETWTDRQLDSHARFVSCYYLCQI